MAEKLWEAKAKSCPEHLSILARMNFVFLGGKGLNLVNLPSSGLDLLTDFFKG